MRRVAAGLTLATALGAVAFTGPASGDASAQAAAKRAAALSAETGSSRFTVSWLAADVPEELIDKMRVEGVMNYVRHRGEIRYWHDQRVIYDGDVVYMKVPLPWRDDAPWLRFKGDSSDEDPFDLGERAMQNPIGLLEFLTGASRDTRTVGSEHVRGAPTTHYEGTLDLQLVVDQAPRDRREELQSMLEFIAEYEATKVPFGLWVDDNGVTRRLRIDGAASVTIEYFDFGIPVAVTPPPEREIISDEQLWQEYQTHAGAEACNADERAGSDPSTGRYSDSDALTWRIEGTSGDITTTDTNTQTVTTQLCARPTDSD